MTPFFPSKSTMNRLSPTAQSAHVSETVSVTCLKSSSNHVLQRSPSPPTDCKRLLSVEVIKGDITKDNSHIIVISCNQNLNAGRHLVNVAGSVVSEELQNYLQGLTEVPVASVVVTRPGSLQCRHLFHAVGPRWRDYKDKTQFSQDLCVTIIKCLSEAYRRKLISIAFSAVSSDTALFGGKDFKKCCAQSYINALKVFESKISRGSLRRIRFVDTNSSMIDAIQKELDAEWEKPFESVTVDPLNKILNFFISKKDPTFGKSNLKSENQTARSVRSNRGTAGTGDRDEENQENCALCHHDNSLSSTHQPALCDHEKSLSATHEPDLCDHEESLSSTHQPDLYDHEESLSSTHQPDLYDHKESLSSTHQPALYDHEKSLSPTSHHTSYDNENPLSATSQVRISKDCVVSKETDTVLPKKSCDPDTSYMVTTLKEDQALRTDDNLLEFHETWFGNCEKPVSNKINNNSEGTVQKLLNHIFHSSPSSPTDCKRMVTVEVIKGDIIKDNSCPIVSSSNQNLLHMQGVTRVIISGKDSNPVRSNSDTSETGDRGPSHVQGPTLENNGDSKSGNSKKTVDGVLRSDVGNSEDTGPMPPGTMTFFMASGQLPGYKEKEHIVIKYTFEDGVQTASHPRPGLKYSGSKFTSFLPSSREGCLVLELMQTAFSRKLLFTVGKQSLHSEHYSVTWGGISQKRNKSGGPAGYGYPDPDYLTRVRKEMARFGIKDTSK